jgi:signal transduction histidine kinase
MPQMTQRARQLVTTRAIAVAIALVTLLLHQFRGPLAVTLALAAAALLPWVPGVDRMPRIPWTVLTLAPAAALYLRGDLFAALFLMLTLARTAIDAPIGLVLAVGVVTEGVVLLPFAIHRQPSGLFFAGGLGLTLFAAWMLRTQQALMVQLDAARADLHRQALADERRRIARDVHDLVAHSLTVVMLQMTAARLRLQRDPRAAGEMLAETERLGRQALVEVRRLVDLLRDDEPAADPLPGAGHLPALVGRLHEAGTDVRLETDGDIGQLSASAGLTLYRVAQEALSNAARHATGAAVQVRLEVGEREARLRVRDWGGGAGRAASRDHAGHGLTGMRERAALAGGRCGRSPPSPAGRWNA